MTLDKECELARQTWQLCQQGLPPQLVSALAAHAKGPQRLDKKDHGQSVVHLRILPVRGQQIPPGFWSATWCFYQVLVGPIDGNLNLGGVQFLQFSGNGACSHGKWLPDITKILRGLEGQKGFVFTERNDRNAVKPQLCTRYRTTSQCKAFPIEQAAGDLAWLIRETFSRFTALGTKNAESAIC